MPRPLVMVAGKVMVVPRNEIIVGDALAELQKLPDGCVQCCVTSPPYWGLRDYGTATWEGGDPECDHQPPDDAGHTSKPTAGQRAHPGRFAGPICLKCGARRIDQQMGLEASPAEYVARMVEVFREVRRVLRDDGVLWLNVGDSYNSQAGNYRGGIQGMKKVGRTLEGGTRKLFKAHEYHARPPLTDGLKPKDLVGIPWMLAFALRDDGWWLRSAMPWVKRSAMPESVTDRPASALEYVFLLTKSARYYFDMDVVRVELLESSIQRLSQPTFDQQQGGPKDYGRQTDENRSARKALCNLKEKLVRQEKWGDRQEGWTERDKTIGRNFRNTDLYFESLDIPHGMIFYGDEPVGLDVNPVPFKEAHFATFPPKLVEPLIKAGTSQRGACPKCGAPWKRVIEKRTIRRKRPADRTTRHEQGGGINACGNTVAGVDAQTLGWQPTCKCGCEDTIPCIVLDPFAGVGTTCIVAAQLNRDYIGIELKLEYAAMAREQLVAIEETAVPVHEARSGQMSLFKTKDAAP